MNNTVVKDFFGFPKVKWLHLTGEEEQSAQFSCDIFSLFNVPKKLLKSVNFDRVIKQINGGRFWDTVYMSFVGEIPHKKNNFGGVNRRFQAKRAKH